MAGTDQYLDIGALGCCVARRGHRSEIITFSLRNTRDSIRAFASEDSLPPIQRTTAYLIECDLWYEIVA